jgi:PAS domain S-box-containing protein
VNEGYQRTQEAIARRLRERDAGQAVARIASADSAAGLPVFGEKALGEFERSSSPMRIFDLATQRFLAVNDATASFYGYSREEFLGMSVADLRHPDEHGALQSSLAEQSDYLRHRPPRRHVTKSGEVMTVEVVTQDVLYQGRRARLSLTIDLTGRLRMQALIWQRQQEFEMLAENLPDLVARFDRGHRFVYVNAAVEKLLKIGRHEMIGKTQRELGMPEGLVSAFERSLSEAFDTGESHTLEFSVAAAGGERLFETSHIPERDAAGQISTVLCVAHDITERKKNEEEVQRQKNLLAAIIDNLPVGVFIKDAATLRYVVRNRFLEELNGDPMETSIGKSAHDLLPKEQADRSVATDRQALESRKLVDIPEQEMLCRSGEQRLFHVRKVPLLDDRGRPQLLVGIADDITDRKRAEHALREGEARFNLAMESTGLGMWDWNVRTSEVWRHPRWARMLGYEPEEVRGHICMWREFCHPDDWERAQGKLMAHMSGTVPDYAAEYRMRKRNGAWLWVACRGKVIERDGDGTPLRMIGYIQDISESKQAESALRESEERFRQLAENIHQVFWITTLPLDKLVYVSPAYEEIWGRNRDSLYSNPRSWMDSVHAEDLPRVRAAAESMARGRPLDAEYRIVRPDGTLRWIRDRSYPMKAGDGAQLACGIAEDITDLKLAEQEKLTHAIHQRDALVREVHHRIKNSLQGVVGLLRQKVRKYPAVAPDIEEAIGQLQSLALVYGLQETRPDGLLSLADITDAICSSAEKLIGGRVERKVERESPEHACIAGAEAVSVAVALNELVFNALKHQPAQAGRKRATVRLRESRGTAEICISNRGNLPKSFDFAGGRSVGYGLGLVRTLLAPPGGKIVFNGGRDKVEVKLTLAPPLLAGRRKAYAK